VVDGGVVVTGVVVTGAVVVLAPPELVHDYFDVNV